MYAQKVGQKLLREILKKTSHDVVQAHAYNIQNMSREMKYIYGLSLFSEPMSAYVWGMLSFEEAEELCYAHRTILNEKTYNWLNEMNASDLTPEQEELRQNTMNKIAQDEPINRDGVLEKLGFSKEKIDECYLSFADTINHLLLKVDFDMYIDSARCFLPSYFPAMARFNKSKLLLLENYFNQKIEEQHKSITFAGDNVHPMDKLLYQLDVINHVIIDLRNRAMTNPFIEKTNQEWKKMAETCFYLTAQKMGELPANQFNPKIKPRMKEVSQTFMRFFDDLLPENQLDFSLYKLAQNTYSCINKTITDKAEKEEMLDKFEADIGIVWRYKRVHKSNLKTVSAQAKAVQIKMEMAWMKAELNALKKKYLTEAELEDKDACRSVYSFMTDSELYYTMGVLTKQEYELCCKHQDKVIEYNGCQAKEPRSISEIFSVLLDLPAEESVVLPLKKEYVKKANQIRQASRLYQALYTDNYRPALMDILPEKFEHNYLDKEDDLFLQEGIYLENMIYVAHHTMQMDVFKSKIPELVDNYWLEAVSGVDTLPRYPNHVHMNETFKHCSKILNEPSQATELIPDIKECTMSGRKMGHEIMVNQLHFALCELYQDKYQERVQMLNRYYQYVRPFQGLLKEPKIVDKQVKSQNISRSEKER